ncbi:MAG: VanZ family protein [Thiohalomonadales bacterium]
MLIIIFSLITLPKTAGYNIPNLDKLEHIFSYFLLMFLFAQCYKIWRIRIIYAVAFISLGVALEILQRFTSTRQFEYADMIANTSGIILGLMFSDGYLRKVVIYVDNTLKNYFAAKTQSSRRKT